MMMMMMIFHVQLKSAMKLIHVKILKIFPAPSNSPMGPQRDHWSSRCLNARSFKEIKNE
jgi:hypothetical protein